MTTAPEYILAIDQGTTGSTAAIIDRNGAIIASSNQEFKQYFPQPSWVEHDPEDIWQSVRTTVQTVLSKQQVDPIQIVGLGITNQRETVLCWDRASSVAYGKAIVWQDRRTADRCLVLREQGHHHTVHQKTGLQLDPYFSATKIEWLLNNDPAALQKAKDNALCVGTVDSYLIYRLSSGDHHVTDLSNASRTMLLNIHDGTWDDTLLNLFSISEDVLPKIVPNTGCIAMTCGIDFLPDGIPICGIAGDQQAALFGQACVKRGDAKCTYGTGAFALVHAGDQVTIPGNGLLGTIAWQISQADPIEYAIEGSTFIAGAAVQWLRDGLNVIDDAAKIEALANQVNSSEGVTMIPALSGLAAPYWDPNATGAILGITRGTNRSHIARATLEGIALRVTELLTCIAKELNTSLSKLKVDGGAAKNNLLMQIQADYAGLTIHRPTQLESTVRGAAFLAGIGIGWWTKDTLPVETATDGNMLASNTFDPTLSPKERATILSHWQSQVQRILSNKQSQPV